MTRCRRHLAVAVLALLGVAACPSGGSDPASDEGEGETGEGEGEGLTGEGEGEGEGEAPHPFGAPVVVARSLFWTAPALVDDPAVVGLGRVMASASDALDADAPGLLFSSLLTAFSTTTHSARFGPARLEGDLRAQLGDDPATWDLDGAPFKVTGVHTRLDLAGVADDGVAHCGELRVSLASIDPVHRPFHLLFLFRLPADDVAVDDVAAVEARCGGIARQIAGLSVGDDAAFVAGARALLDDVLPHFLLIESVDFTVAPWEWRQWIPVDNPDSSTAAALPRVFGNPPLFQQVDSARAATDATFRAALSTFVADNAAALDARQLLVPARFRAPSVRVNAGVPWAPLALDLPDDVVAAHPRLRQQVEIVGCAACHTADADFVQTREDRTVSPFYEAELRARRAWLQALVDLEHPDAPPFGPLQETPRLPP